VTYEEKCREYLKLCKELVEYLRYCADKGMRPLAYDLDVYEGRLERVRSKRVDR